MTSPVKLSFDDRGSAFFALQSGYVGYAIVADQTGETLGVSLLDTSELNEQELLWLSQGSDPLLGETFDKLPEPVVTLLFNDLESVEHLIETLQQVLAFHGRASDEVVSEQLSNQRKH